MGRDSRGGMPIFGGDYRDMGGIDIEVFGGYRRFGMVASAGGWHFGWAERGSFSMVGTTSNVRRIRMYEVGQGILLCAGKVSRIVILMN